MLQQWYYSVSDPCPSQIQALQLCSKGWKRSTEACCRHGRVQVEVECLQGTAGCQGWDKVVLKLSTRQAEGR